MSPSRTPHGVRELKRVVLCAHSAGRQRRTPHGVRELKLDLGKFEDMSAGRTPHGVRELKLDGHRRLVFVRAVAPRTGCVN